MIDLIDGICDYLCEVHVYIDYGSLVRTLIFTFLVKHRVNAG